MTSLSLACATASSAASADATARIRDEDEVRAGERMAPLAVRSGALRSSPPAEAVDAARDVLGDRHRLHVIRSAAELLATEMVDHEPTGDCPAGILVRDAVRLCEAARAIAQRANSHPAVAVRGAAVEDPAGRHIAAILSREARADAVDGVARLRAEHRASVTR